MMLSRCIRTNLNLLKQNNLFNKYQHFARSFSKPSLNEFSEKVKLGPTLGDFIQKSTNNESHEHNHHNHTEAAFESSLSQSIPYLLSNENQHGEGRKVFIESYGCQMNMADSEIVRSVLSNSGYLDAETPNEADVVFLNTCAIRENAESKIWSRLTELKAMRKKRDITVGVLGCMAERLKTKLIESDKMVDLVAGPDAYRDLPRLLSKVDEGEQAINVLLSLDETYADITPVRTSSNKVSAFVSIMRGCNNMCSYCIVPFTRGRERSRDVQSILDEVKLLSDQGYKEVTLLGQNVNSYNYIPDDHGELEDVKLRAGFKTIYKPTKSGVNFTELVNKVSGVNSEMRIRFTSPHPKDFPDELLHLISERPNLCKSLHIPAQSGNSNVLNRMRRGYTRESYMSLINSIRKILPNCAISSDFISGFCGESEQEHQDTISLLEEVKYEQAFMFAYSVREKTHAHRTMEDNVPEEVKARRLKEVIDTFHHNLQYKNAAEIGKVHLVLVEGHSRRSKDHLTGRSDTNKKINFPDIPIPSVDNPYHQSKPRVGDYVVVKIDESSGVAFKGTPILTCRLDDFRYLKDKFTK
eukprot:TRINITY_DN349_c0_g1_i1.p1 TRINITY_DN349_c0_g1~~TRINITY_DN349_c0_g1_i1.p1  ORF type:complete len:582 (+),score=79.25 TRINITY_DN349_c0_g1_i1:243-1988(+)